MAPHFDLSISATAGKGENCNNSVATQNIAESIQDKFESLSAPKCAMRVLLRFELDPGLSIEDDLERFNQIVKGRAREELKRYLNQGELLIEKEDGVFSVSVPHIDLPRFIYGDNQEGQGQGRDGNGQQPGGSRAGKNPGSHAIELEVSLEELVDFLRDDLDLPRLEPKGNPNIEDYQKRYNSISQKGPNSLRHFKRSFREALIRQAASGTYDPEQPVVVPIREDLKFRAPQPKLITSESAVIFHVIDVSGSMGKDQKDLARTVSSWTDAWISSHYKEALHVYITHDTAAYEVDKETFYRQREDGGTVISSAYEAIIDLIETRFSPEQWNIYIFQYSDGDNSSAEDTSYCIDLIREKLLGAANLFAYGQVKSAHSSGGGFLEALKQANLDGCDNVVLCRIPHKRAVKGVVEAFLSNSGNKSREEK